MKLEDKVAIVTGGASGIGKAMALLFAKEGAKVVIGDLNEKAAGEVVLEIEESGGKAIAVVGDCCTPEGADKLVSAATSTYGSLDILCNNAGVLDGLTPAAEVTDELWDKVIAVNLTGPMMLSRRALAIMLEQGSGAILNTSSVASDRAGRGGAAYTASKHGVNGLTKSIAFHYGDKGIRCNAISPGAIMTPMAIAKMPNQTGMEKMAPFLPLIQRYGQPEEVANAALFLVSEESKYINGSILTIDNGWALG